MTPLPEFAGHLQAFFTDRLIRQRQASPHTIGGYRDTFRLLLAFARQRLQKEPSRLALEDLDAPLIGAFLDHLEQARGNSARTRNVRLAAMHSFFRSVALQAPTHSAVIQRVLAMPSKRYDRRPIGFLTRPEMEALLAAPARNTWAGQRDHALLLVAVQTGLRVSELSACRKIMWSFGVCICTVAPGARLFAHVVEPEGRRARQAMAHRAGHPERVPGAPLCGGARVDIGSGRGRSPGQAHGDVPHHDRQGSRRAATTGGCHRVGSGTNSGRRRGRPTAEAVHPGLRAHLTQILDESTAGDPMSPLKWTGKSTRAIAAELARRGYPVHWTTVARCLHDLDYSLQGNVKALEGKSHPDRDAQFHYINARVKAFGRTRDPVISVDTQKKELVGPFRNTGRTWRPQGQPYRVNTHDFPQLAAGKAIPYGTYDVARNHAVVNVGVTHDTAEFAVESIRRWWRLLGKHSYPTATRLLISADAGGRNGARLRAWKVQLQRLASELKLPVTVCHYPPGTSKWNKIEHRLFSFISLTWKGQPLVSYEAVVNLIGQTHTRTGLRVKALLDTRTYRTGARVTTTELNALRLKRHQFHPDWNYTLLP